MNGFCQRPREPRGWWCQTALALLITLVVNPSHAKEIGFIERFALAENRADVLEELIPGTEDYYYFHALHYQNTGEKTKFNGILGQWRKRFEKSSRRGVLENRQALIGYEDNPQATLDYLKKALGVHFNHQRERKQTDPSLATTLDPALISMDTIVKQALRDDRKLGEVGSAGIDWLMLNWKSLDLSVPQKRAILSKLSRPDYPDLVEAIVEDLRRKESKGFGEHSIHRLLTLAQMKALGEKRSSLLGEETYVLTVLSKMHPNAEIDMDRNPDERAAYLERSWDFVSGLGGGFHSLKAHVLYQQLKLDESRGEYKRDRFLTYLKLPRPVPYLNVKYRDRMELWRHPVNMDFDCSTATGLAPIVNDEAVVRSYLLHFLTGASDFKEFAPYVTEDYLKTVQAEANIVGGHGDAEQWASQLTPSAYQALKERVDLDFDPTCQEHFTPGERVRVALHVKNVANLIVKIYEINTESYYRNFQRPINTDLNLDGLVANEELAFDYDVSPFQRVKREFDFPQLDTGRGVWVLEFIGNGKSSRALIRRGGLQYLMQPGSAGHALRLLDEKHQAVPNAYVWMQDKRYDPDESGEIVIPFSNSPGGQTIILNDGQGFASLENLVLQGENYKLQAGFYVDREALIGGRQAVLAVRPQFTLNGLPSDVKLLENIVLTLTSTDFDGVESTATVEDFQLFPHKESTHKFRVPNRLNRLAYRLTAKVKNLSQGKEINLQSADQLMINEIDQTNAVSDLYLSKVAEGYRVQLLGRSGEPLPNHAINLSLRRDDFRDNVRTTLKTDDSGTVHLGALEGIYRVTAEAPNGRKYRWVLPVDQRLYPSTIHARVGENIRIPVMNRSDAGREAFSLLEQVNGSYVRDCLDTVSLDGDYAEIKGLSPGNYLFYLKKAKHGLTIRVSSGVDTEGFLLAKGRTLEKSNETSLQLEPLKTVGENLVIQLANTNALTRVHVLASHYVPAFESFDALGLGSGFDPILGVPAKSKNHYLSGRAIGDEYRYIIERRFAEKHPGNMLKRPGLLLNPWSLRDTSTEIQDLKEGQEWKSEAEPQASLAKRRSARQRRGEEGGLRDPHAFHFLAQSSVTAYNVAPDENGVILLKLADLADCRYVRVLAMDPMTSVERNLALPAGPVKTLDRRLANGLNAKRHFLQQDQVTILEPEKAFVIEDAVSSEFEIYETLESVYQLFRTLNGDSKLEEFSFLLDWPGLEEAKKLELYSKYASHELSFFLHQKDPAFFESIILPYLENKKDNTFMDHYLLGYDLNPYLEPWRFARLNVVERILMAGRLPEQQDGIVRDVSDWLAMLPPEERLELTSFGTALRGGELDFSEDASTASLGLRRAKGLESKLKSSVRLRKAAQPPAVSFGFDADADGAVPEAAQGIAMDSLAALVEEADEEEALGEISESLGRFAGSMEQARKQRGRVRQLYRKLEATREWAENNYYHLPIAKQNRELVTVNKFWNDFASRDSNQPFISRHVTEATGNFTEMLLALAVLDLPFAVEDDDESATLEDTRLTLKPSSPAILFHKEIREVGAAGQAGQLLVSQNFFRESDRYEQRGTDERVDKFVTEEFLTGVVYGCQVVVTNPTSSLQRLDLLQQIPQGSIPVSGSKVIANGTLRLDPFQTHTQDYHFYFPAQGEFTHFPVHVSKDKQVVAFAEPFTFNVVEALTKTDTSSWDYVSQWGTEEETLAYLNKNNLRQTDLSKIAWRCRENAGFFTQVVALLDARHHYDSVVYSYALHHGVTEPLRDYLLHADGFLKQCGAYLKSPLVSIDPVERRNYQHLEYSPLVNARTYALGGKRKILNDRFHQQYGQLMQIYSHRQSLEDKERMTLAVYLLLQDRVSEGLEVVDKINRDTLSTPLQYDYLQAYLAFYREEPSTARAIADRYANHPAERWRTRFKDMLAQLDEIEGKAPQVNDRDDRDQLQNQLAATDPSLTFKVADGKLDVLYRNIEELTVSYYRMDLEFLFSTNPFASSDVARFSMIKPNRTDRLTLDASREGLEITLPEEFSGENVLVEVSGGGLRKASAYYSNSLNVHLSPNYGQLKVTHADDWERPLTKVYVKVYAEIDGQPQFYKDGYTDLRGKFDYASLSTDEIERASRFSILVMSESNGALVEETKPPQR